jgi:hypothetical protein
VVKPKASEPSANTATRNTFPRSRADCCEERSRNTPGCGERFRGPESPLVI